MRTKYANRPENPEVYPTPPPERPAFVKPKAEPKPPPAPQLAGWPFDAAEAKKRQGAAGLPAELKLEVADGVTMDFVLIPAGKFVMGDTGGCPDEWPAAVVTIDEPFYLGKHEVTNAQFAAFDPAHEPGEAKTDVPITDAPIRDAPTVDVPGPGTLTQPDRLLGGLTRRTP